MNEEWKEMQNIWAATNPGGTDVDRILSYVAERSDKFDRKIRWRNRREWIGGVVGVTLIAGLMTTLEGTVEIVSVMGIGALVIGLCLHLWLEGRSEGQVDPSLSRAEYRSALERKFNRQIRMLRKATYWFLLPLFVTGVATIWSYKSGTPGEADWLYFPLILATTALAWLANNVFGVRAIRRDWEKVRRALDDGNVG